MLKRTHEAFSMCYWTGQTLCLNTVAIHMGHPPLVNLALVAIGALLVRPFSAGKNSPDIDQKWWPGGPRLNPRKLPIKESYYIWGHRGLTHRHWFVSLLTLPFLAVALLLWSVTGMTWIIPLCLMLPDGWWSHLHGDMIFGKLRVCGVPLGLGLSTGGFWETGVRKDGTRVLPVRPAAKLFFAFTILFAYTHVYMQARYFGYV